MIAWDSLWASQAIFYSNGNIYNDSSTTKFIMIAWDSLWASQAIFYSNNNIL